MAKKKSMETTPAVVPDWQRWPEFLRSWSKIEERIAHGLEIYPYQIESAIRVIEDLHGSAILADEVGLGKTIEAGLIMMEMWSRGLIQRALILTPAGLITQWIGELHDKFGWDAQRSPHDKGWLWVLSLDTAKRPPLSVMLQYVEWDLVIVDEAHHLKNPHTLNYELVAGLKARHLLLLTATPMENELNELYNLVNLVKPGLFGSYLKFYRQFILDRRTPRNAAELRALLARVMVRHQRQEVGLRMPPREVTLWPIVLEADGPERQLYERLSRALKGEYHERIRDNQTILPLITLQRELCSTPQALLGTLRSSDWLGDRQAELVRLAESIEETQKVRSTVELVRRLGGQILIFTEFRATQETLVATLAACGIEARAFHGGVRPRERDHLVEWFRGKDRVLVATEAGGQGLNLQFCHRLINFDLPWNPMRIEQRIGRVHRIGQENVVEIFNLYTVDSVEEDILRLLHEKIDLFRTVIGELDIILRHLERRGSLEGRLLDIFFGEEHREEMEARLDQLAKEFQAARRRMQWPGADLEESTSQVSGESLH